MPNAIEFSRAAQDQVLEAVKQSQQAVVEGVELWAKSVEQFTPKSGQVPFAEELPTPKELVDNSFDFAGRLLAAQHEFAQKVLGAASPVLKTTAPKSAKSA